ncbi:MAG: helix-turn-helix domain-containing protein [Planctomycetes bacterium]|nr:helix-turn-helix domain-containing protein [Planctomycetota bacterium]
MLHDFIDKVAVAERFFSCYPKMTSHEAARFFKVSQSTVVLWKTKGLVPWRELKFLSDSQGISWDWLLEDRGEKYSGKTPKAIRNRYPKFPKESINSRFFSLYDGLSHKDIAEKLGISVSRIYSWHKGEELVPWRWLKHAVDSFGVKWDWLIDDIPPKHRNTADDNVKNNLFQFSIYPNTREFDKEAIGGRFFSCYPGVSKRAVAHLLQSSQSYVVQWHTQGFLPWSKMKYLSDSQAISWDWLLEGIMPKESVKKARTPKSLNPTFPVAQINTRFFSLFPQTKQITIANIFEVTDGTVSNWKHNRAQVPWRRLAAVVHAFNLRWDWLIDGLPPKRRE